MLEGQIDESDEPMEDMRGQLETLLKQRLGVEKELTQAKTNLAENEHIIRGLEQKRNGIGAVEQVSRRVNAGTTRKRGVFGEARGNPGTAE